MYFIRLEEVFDFFVIYCGGNDLGDFDWFFVELIEYMFESIISLVDFLLKIKLVWF